MTSLTMIVAMHDPAARPVTAGLKFRTKYQRIVRAADPAQRDSKAELAPAEHRLILSDALGGTAEILDYADGTTIEVAILDRQDAVLIDLGERKPAVPDGRAMLDIVLDEGQVKQIVAAATPKPPQSLPTISARAEFKATDNSTLDYAKYTLVVAPAKRAALPEEKLEIYFPDRTGGALSCVLETPPNITMTLTNSANDDRRVSVGNLYEAGVTGRFRDLKRIEHTIRLEPGEQTRVRLAWNNSAGFTPASVRLLEQAWDPGTAVYNVNGAALSLASTSGAASRPKPATPVPAAALATANSFTRPLASAGSGASIGAVPVT